MSAGRKPLSEFQLKQMALMGRGCALDGSPKNWKRWQLAELRDLVDRGIARVMAGENAFVLAALSVADPTAGRRVGAAGGSGVLHAIGKDGLTLCGLFPRDMREGAGEVECGRCERILRGAAKKSKQTQK